MADEISLQELEELEKLCQHRIDLLNEADRALRQESDALDTFMSKHPDLHATGHMIPDSIKNIESVLNDTVAQHNAVMAKVAELKEQTKQQAADPGY